MSTTGSAIARSLPGRALWRLIVLAGLRLDRRRRAVDATARGDFNLIQGLVLLIATIFVLVNLVVDLLYGWLDPRISLR